MRISTWWCHNKGKASILNVHARKSVRLQVGAPLEPQPTVHDQKYPWCNFRQCSRRELDCDLLALNKCFGTGMCARGAVHWPVLYQQHTCSPHDGGFPRGLLAKSAPDTLFLCTGSAPHFTSPARMSQMSLDGNACRDKTGSSPCSQLLFLPFQISKYIQA
jgi:hypothetical protein